MIVARIGAVFDGRAKMTATNAEIEASVNTCSWTGSQGW